MADERETFVRRLDGRIKLAALFAACFICQYAPLTLLPFWVAALAVLFFIRDMRREGIRTMFAGGMYFIAFWTILTLGLDLLLGKPAAEA
ncbi:MAG: hypothetical protein LBS30_01835, partial [Planctomycetota bacterium]|nr:hypothetical protein [Planctomycetota bacterium]